MSVDTAPLMSDPDAPDALTVMPYQTRGTSLPAQAAQESAQARMPAPPSRAPLLGKKARKGVLTRDPDPA